MQRKLLTCTFAICATVAFSACTEKPEGQGQDLEQTNIMPDWEKFRSIPMQQRRAQAPANYSASEGQFTFADLKYESDASLAKRLLGALSSRIVYIDRGPERWQYYSEDSESMDSITLFSRPEPWGSAYGICRVERYEIHFEQGKISSVDVFPRYGVEGPIFQKAEFDWDEFRGPMCREVAPNNTPSYFPASDSVLDAQALAILLSLAIDEAGREGAVTYELSCETYLDEPCHNDIIRYLSELRLNDIDSVSRVNCTDADDDCFTIVVGEHRLGAFPKHITIKGSTHMNEWRVSSVHVLESFTVS